MLCSFSHYYYSLLLDILRNLDGGGGQSLGALARWQQQQPICVLVCSARHTLAATALAGDRDNEGMKVCRGKVVQSNGLENDGVLSLPLSSSSERMAHFIS